MLKYFTGLSGFSIAESQDVFLHSKHTKTQFVINTSQLKQTNPGMFTQIFIYASVKTCPLQSISLQSESVMEVRSPHSVLFVHSLSIARGDKTIYSISQTPVEEYRGVFCVSVPADQMISLWRLMSDFNVLLSECTVSL